MCNIVDKFTEDLFSISGFDQFKDTDSIEVEYIETNGEKEHFTVILNSFLGMDYGNISSYSYGPYEGKYFSDINGHVSSGDPEGIYIQFSAYKKPD